MTSLSLIVEDLLDFPAQDELFGVSFKVLAECVDNAENISNSVIINHSGIL